LSSHPLKTFSITFDGREFDESDQMREVVEKYSTHHFELDLSPELASADAINDFAYYADEPNADAGALPVWFLSKLSAKHVTVALSGEGADELFGGYTIYREPLSLAAFERVPGALRRTLGRISMRIPEGVRGKDLLRRGALTLEQRYYGNARIFREDQLRGVLRGYDPTISHSDVTADPYAASTGWDPVARMQHVDLFTWLRGDILVKADKVTMANSLELRVPFLDPEVFRVASTIPLAEKITRETTKHALRQALRDIVPGHVLNRPKLGFPVPIRHWLRNDLYDWARSIIDDSGTAEFLDLAAVRRMLDEHRTGPRDHSRRIWAVVVFMLWHGIFIEQRISPVVPEPRYPVHV
jgi:asparagine synthase (glutamine-hydrolysing)